METNLYIELLDISKEPILLKAYDTYFKKLEKTIYYKINGVPKLINGLNFENTKICLDTNEGKYEVKKKIKNWMPDNKLILTPVIIGEKYDLDIKYVVKERVNLVPDGETKIYEIKFEQEYFEIRDKNIYIGEIDMEADLLEVLKSELPKYYSYSVSKPIKKILKDHPEWKIAEKL